MSSRRDVWMPLYIADYLADTTDLTAAQHGSYLLLIMAYWRSGPLPDDDKMLARMARCEGRHWSSNVGPRVREFFQPRDGRLHHKRIDIELQKSSSISETRRQAGRKSRANRSPAEPERDDSPVDDGAESGSTKYANLRTQRDTNPVGPTQHSDRTNGMILLKTDEANATHLPIICGHTRVTRARGLSQSQSQSQKEDTPCTPPRATKRVAADRGERLTDDWKLSDFDCQFALGQGLDPVAVSDAFRDYWISQPGAKGRKLDWSATWRNWCRREAENSRPKRKDAPKKFGTASGAIAHLLGLSGLSELPPSDDDETK